MDTSAGAASACHLMNPLFGALLSWAILGTPLRADDFAGATIIALGLWTGTAKGERMSALVSNPKTR